MRYVRRVRLLWVMVAVLAGVGRVRSSWCGPTQAISVAVHNTPPLVYSASLSSDIPTPLADTESLYFVGSLPPLVEGIIQQCCGPDQYVEYHVYENSRHMAEEGYNETLAFPVSFSEGMTAIYALTPDSSDRYMPVCETHGPSLVAHSDIYATAFAEAFLSSWPLLVVVITSASVAAIFIWLIEVWSGKDSFPKRFIRGYGVGLWWSFVTMSTVGYGDKVARSLLGRAFTVVWMLIGMVVMSSLTAALATAFSITGTTFADIRGKPVGVLNGSNEYLTALIHGAQPRVAPDIGVLLEKLDSGADYDMVLLDYLLVSEAEAILTYRNLIVLDFIYHPSTHGITARGLPAKTLNCMQREISRQRFSVFEQSLEGYDQTPKTPPSAEMSLPSESYIIFWWIYFSLALWFVLFVVCLIGDQIWHGCKKRAVDLAPAPVQKDGRTQA